MRRSVLIELDALLDTRIGTVSRLNSDDAIKLIQNGAAYRTRLSDDLNTLVPSINLDEYKGTYKARDADTLAVSSITPFVIILREIASQFETALIHTPLMERATIDVNVYPYKLTTEETMAIQQCISHYVNSVTMEVKAPKAATASPSYTAMVEVRMLNIPGANLDPGFIKAGYGTVILYDFWDGWLSHFINYFAEGGTRLPQVTFIIPDLYKDSKSIPTKTDVVFSDKGEALSVFKCAQVYLAPYLNLDMVSIEYFSLMAMPNLEEIEQLRNKWTTREG